MLMKRGVTFSPSSGGFTSAETEKHKGWRWVAEGGAGGCTWPLPSSATAAPLADGENTRGSGERRIDGGNREGEGGRGVVVGMGVGGGVPHRRFLFDLSPLQCALTRRAAGAALSLAVSPATRHDDVNRRPIWPPVTPPPSLPPSPALPRSCFYLDQRTKHAPRREEGLFSSARRA